MSTQVKTFQAEIKEILDLMIHSLYSKKEVFLRELISNASDALDKRRVEGLSDGNVATSDELAVRLEIDEPHRILKIKDNGIGMTTQEVEEYLGTIAHSGTKKWAQLKKDLSANPELIGQFGVGFYSAFMVADEVTVHTQKAGTSSGTVWKSSGAGEYTVSEAPRPEGPGTTISLKLKTFEEEDNELDFIDEHQIKSLIKKYSDFISYPIKMMSKSEVPKKDSEGKVIEGEFEEVVEDQTLNSQKALWLRSPSEIKPDEYNEFYKHLTHEWADPLKTVHFRAEGTLEFSSLLYIPSKRPFNFNYRDTKWGLSLYAKRVFIMGDCESILPEYLRFVKGVVDSSDLSLNVSREMLQQDRQVVQIKKSLVSKILKTLSEMKNKEPENYLAFWKEFGTTLKEGIAVDADHKSALLDLMLFNSSTSENPSSLKDYISRMKEDQTSIFYITGDNLATMKSSPHVEQAMANGIEVIYFIDTIDDWIVDLIGEYEGKRLQAITKEGVDLLTTEQKSEREKLKSIWDEKYKELLTNLNESLKEGVREVQLSERMKDSAVCLVSGAYDPSARLEKMMSTMGLGQNQKPKRILEINPEHPLIDKLSKASKEKQIQWGAFLVNQALLSEGSSIENPGAFAKQVSELLLSAELN
ncbi:MAG: molecular chaperone HtpG [Bdellovibrionales bacterium CG10_big_fil_rev_8_21_14_0_10_45_34]|nr:MAG: molecular chaperone HtpG [Bdellovibrionales bacterium CG10_big_fil_rev_8_21_14_0_10_45_34]